jgi:ABC-type phosphate/phosphonate transport system substrate-binding protein
MRHGAIREMLIALLALGPAVARAQEPIDFIGIEAFAEDDKQLRGFLTQKTGLQFQTHTMAYNTAVRRLSESGRSQRYLAHMTPYACVAAEMLGAKFEILATYHSKTTSDEVYHSFFVVNKDDVNKILTLGHKPGLAEFQQYLDERTKLGQTVRFVYQDKFSTSSYFLPSLYLRDEHVFAITESAGGSQKRILVEKAPPGEKARWLVDEVAAGRAQLAAVSDELANRPAPGAAVPDYFNKVYFVPLQAQIPNDLLVMSTALVNEEDSPKAEILKAIEATKETSGKDAAKRWNGTDNEFQYWVNINEAAKALDALGELRRLAGTNQHYVTVSVHWSGEPKSRDEQKARLEARAREEMLQAVMQGIRLSGTEFVLYDKDFHKNLDVTWTLESIHDGAIAISSQIGEEDLVPLQRFSVSFMNASDLTTRVAALVRGRMHRIRYVWPYQDNYPAVIRDFEFKPQKEVTLQRIVWTDLERNEYQEGIPFKASIVKQDDYKLQLSEELFPRGPEGNLQFEPMSNIAYRVILKRRETQEPLFSFLTTAFVTLLVLSALGCAWDLRRKRPAPVGFSSTYQRLIDDYHAVWRERRIRESDVLWCDPQIDDEIKKFREKTPLSQEVGNMKVPWLNVSVGLVDWLIHQLFTEKLKLAPELRPASEVGNAEALDRLIKYLVRRRRLSSFAGKPVEWDALDDIVRRNFYRLNIGQTGTGAHLSRDTALAGMVSRHFQDVLEKSKVACLFHHCWDLEETATGFRLIHREDLGGDLRIVLKEGAVVTRTLVLELELPKEPNFPETLTAANGDAWVLASIPGPAQLIQNGTGQIRVPLKAIALLRSGSEADVVQMPRPLALTKGAA